MVWSVIAVTFVMHLSSEASQDETSFEEKLLETLPEGVNALESVISPDGRRVAYCINRVGKGVAVVGGQKSEDYTKVGVPSFSPDGKTVSYTAVKDRKAFVVVNGKAGEAFTLVEPAEFGPDGSSFLYQAFRDGKHIVVAGDRRGKDYFEIGDKTFSPDSSKVAYAGKTRSDEDSWRLVVDGQEVGEDLPRIARPVFSPDGSRVAALAWTGDYPHNKSCVVVNGRRLREGYTYVSFPSFRPDGKVFYAANRGGKPLPELRNTLSGATGGKWYLVVEDAEVEVPVDVDEVVSSPFVGPDKRRSFYIARKGQKKFWVVDGKKGPEFSSVVGREFGDEGRTFAYVGRSSEGDRLVLDGTASEDVYETIRWFKVSPEGKSVALAVSTKLGMQAVVGSRKSDVFDLIFNLRFSNDGKKLAFGAWKGREVWWKVMDVSTP